jgi:putative transposase
VGERKAMIDKEAELSVVKQCELLGLNRSSVYYEVVLPCAEELTLMRLIDELHLKLPFAGSRRMVSELAARGYAVNRKRIQRLMRLMGIEAICPKPGTSRANKHHKIYPYLLKDLTIDKPNGVWAADITYLPMSRGFAYLVAIMDVYSRKILAWQLSNSLDVRFCLEALTEAIKHYGTPEIFNTDQGAQFTSEAFSAALLQHDIRISMDGKGRWKDNVFIERFWRTLKYEEVYLHAYTDLNDARVHLHAYMAYYNQQRTHSSLANQTPQQVYTQTMNSSVFIPQTMFHQGYTPRPCS